MNIYNKPKQHHYDAIIVGSGAGGGMASKILSQAGLSVAVVEAGSDFDPAKEEYRTQLKIPLGISKKGSQYYPRFWRF